MAREPDVHIVVFTDTFFETNGVGSYYKTLLGWFRDNRRAGLTILCPRRDDLAGVEEFHDVIPVRPSIQFRNPFYKDLPIGYFSRPMLRRIVSRLPSPQVIHVATSGPLGVAGASVARQLGIPAVGCYHTNLHFYAQMYGKERFGRAGAWVGAWVARFCDQQAYGRCRAVCAPSVSAEESVRLFYHGPTRVIPNPIDLKRLRPADSRNGRFRERFGSPGKALVIAVGRVAQEKNLDLVGERLGCDERIDLVFVGDGPYAPELRKRWNARVTGFLHGDELLEAYQQADVFVQLSISETFGLSLVEALACGLPAIVLRSAGFVDTIPPGQGVEILEREELVHLADRCVALATDRARQHESSRKACALVQRLGADAVLPLFAEFHRAQVQSTPPLSFPRKTYPGVAVG